ncbi:MAG: YdcF family protein [Anaerolineae bacterium]|nr:YdcF family protein [Anaerolineae bacterium]MDW8068524.1 YdcF family protein [Anaerolineae bacterium]
MGRGQAPRNADKLQPCSGWAVLLRAGGYLIIVVSLFFLPQVALIVRYNNGIYEQLDAVPEREYAVVFGAYVFEDDTLSDAAWERIEAGVQLYRQRKVRKLFISGDNESNQQADAMARYARERGVAEQDILVDPLGIDTHDTCRHFAQFASEGILVTQAFHLPRAMWMCEREGVNIVGVASNRLGLLSKRGEYPLAIYGVRIQRFLRESALTWAFALGIYDRVSNKAEQLEQ